MKLARYSSLWRLTSILMVSALVLAACTTPTPERIVETVVVPEVQTQIVQQTSVVRETSIVEVPVEITATPAAGTGPALNPDVSGELELWHFWASPVRRNAILRVIALCQSKLPNITIVDTVKPFGDLWTANVAAVAAGSGMPDVIVSDRPTLPRDGNDGVYMDLAEWAERDGVTRDQFYDWAWDQGTLDAAVYGIPHETDVSVLFYNKQLFEAAGLDPNSPPETWEDVEAAADALDIQNDDGSFERIGFFPLWNRGMDIWQYTNDGEMLAPDGTPQINNENMVETTEWVKTWVDRYGGWDALQEFNAQYNTAPPNDNFMSNRVAMRADIFGYNSQLEFYRPRADINGDLQVAGDEPRMEWGVSLLPHNADADAGTWSGGFAMSIPTGAANPEAAWEFIKCATGPEGQASWARDTQAQPTNIAAAEDPVVQARPQWDLVDEALATSTGGVYLSAYPNWNEQLNQRWDQVWQGTLTAQEALDQAQEAVQAEVQ
jgi:multiple sugar transport system substrate-binding protein